MKKRNMGHLRTVLHRGIITCLAVAMAFGVSIESLAAKEGKVTADMANIRSSADAGADRVAQLPQDSAFTVTEETTDGSDYVWYNIVFTLDGAQKSGWIRSDLAEITYDDTQAGEEDPAAASTVVDGITLMEPAEQPEVTGDFAASQVMVGETPVTAWSVNSELTGGAEFYLVYGMDAAGVGGWYFYDLAQGTLQRAAGQFSGGGASDAEGLIEALRMENADLKAAQEKSVAIRNYIIIGLAALAVVLLIVVIVLAVKLNQIEYVDDDEYDDDECDDDEEDEDDDRKDGMPSWMELAKARKEEARKQKSVKDELEEAIEEEEEEFLEAYMESKEEPEKAVAKAVEAQSKSFGAAKAKAAEDDFDDLDDFDIEIVDLDDLDL